jgi:TolB-like protein
MRLLHASALFSLALLLPACASGPGPAQVTPADLAAIEADRAESAQDPDALTRVGIRFYEAQAFGRARDVLTSALSLRPAFNTAIYLGLSEVALGQFDDAERTFRMAGALPLSSGQRDELDRRMATLSRTRLFADAKQAVARESTLSKLAPLPNTVAVMPWTFIGSDQSLRPLGLGVTHLMVTDLAQVSGLKLVERERVQALLDEMALTAAGRADPATAVRTGRLLRASRVVQGFVRETQDGIRIEATVIRTSDGAVEASGGAGDRLSHLFAVEKAVVLDLVGQLGLALSPAEQRALSERPTEDIQTFLAFSRGLEAQGRGDYASATRLFAAASERDPAFGAARSLLDVNAHLAPPTPDGTFRTASLRSTIQVIVPSTGGEIDRRTRMPFSNPRLPEALGQDNPSKLAAIGSIIIVIPRP